MDLTTEAARHGAAPAIFFDRRELDLILRLYGVFVAAGEWRDYAIDGLADRAVFSVFRQASEAPLYRIEKEPRLRTRQGAYAIRGGNGQVLKRGHELATILRHFDRQKLRLV